MTWQYLSIKEKIDALQDEGHDEGRHNQSFQVTDAAVDSAASVYFPREVWESEFSEGLKNSYRQDAREELLAAAPYLRYGKVTDQAITAVAKHAWESRGNGKWANAGTEDRVAWLTHAHKVLQAVIPQH